MLRGGLLGMAAILAMGSDGERSSPVERGAWVMRKLLHDPPPPAPPNVPQLSRHAGKLLPARELQKAHMEQPQCAQCHRTIDPIGYGLENFNAVGLWRDEEYTEFAKDNRVIRSKLFPIDAAGTLPDGDKFQDFFQLRDAVAGHEAAFARGLIERLDRVRAWAPLWVLRRGSRWRTARQCEKDRFQASLRDPGSRGQSPLSHEIASHESSRHFASRVPAFNQRAGGPARARILRGEAFCSGRRRRRGRSAGVLGFGWGVTKETWFPASKQTGADYELPEGLPPLARHKQDFTIIQNLGNQFANNAHWGSTFWLTGANRYAEPGQSFTTASRPTRSPPRLLARTPGSPPCNWAVKRRRNWPRPWSVAGLEPAGKAGRRLEQSAVGLSPPVLRRLDALASVKRCSSKSEACWTPCSTTPAAWPAASQERHRQAGRVPAVDPRHRDADFQRGAMAQRA